MQGSAAVNLCTLASGGADANYEFGLHVWDFAAAGLIVEEAGGIFKQMDGSEMIYNRKELANKKGFYVVNRKDNIFVGN